MEASFDCAEISGDFTLLLHQSMDHLQIALEIQTSCAHIGNDDKWSFRKGVFSFIQEFQPDEYAICPRVHRHGALDTTKHSRTK